MVKSTPLLPAPSSVLMLPPPPPPPAAKELTRETPLPLNFPSIAKGRARKNPAKGKGKLLGTIS